MTKAALDNDRTTIVALALIVVAGFWAYFTLPQAEDPGFTIRTAVVITFFPGASPQRVESLVSDKIEEVVQEIPELSYVESESRTGFSQVIVNIRQEYDEMQPIWDDLREKIDAIRDELPEGLIGPRVDDDIADTFGILVTLVGEGYAYAELEEIAKEVRDELLRLRDAAKVEIHGVQEERIFVEFDDARLAELGFSAGQLQQILVSRNIVNPGGSLVVGRERIVLEPSGNFDSLDEIRRTVVALPGRSQVVYLEDLVNIRRGYVDPPEQITRSKGERALVLGVSLREGGSILELGEEVAKTIARLEARYPIGVEFLRVADQPARVERKVDEFVSNLLQAIGIVLLVMLLTLGPRTGVLVSSLIPATILMALMIMGLLGVGLDQISLAALIIALGMLIDNAIVMSESIIVLAREGKSVREAAIESGRELRVPLLTSSLTTAAAFLPFYLAESESGEYTGVIFVVVAITLLSSWVLALTLIPLLCVKFLRVEPRRKRPKGKQGKEASAAEKSGEENYDTPFYRRYRRTLLFGLRHRVLVVIGAIVLFALAVWSFRFLPDIFFPRSDRSFFTVQFELPLGTDIRATDEAVAEIETFINEELAGERVTSFVSFVGGGEPRYILNFNAKRPRASYAFLLVNTKSFADVAPSIDLLESFTDERFPDAVATIRPSDMGPPVEKPVQVRLIGSDIERLFQHVEIVKERLYGIEGAFNVTDDWGVRTKKLVVDVDQPRARRANVSNQDIATSLLTSLSGVTTTEFREADETIPIVLRSERANELDIAALETLNVYSQVSGRAVPLSQVANVRVVWEPAVIQRRDTLRTVTVEADVREGVTAAEVDAQVYPWLAEQAEDWPPGYRFEQGGESEESRKAQASIGVKLPIAVLIVVLLLVGQFNSLRKPLIVLSAIPLSIVGVVAGLLLLDSYFGFMTLLGIVSLAGIVINNAIVLLDRIRLEQEVGGLEAPEAVLNASQRRLRPILLTTATTIGGLLPLYLGGGPMWEPMTIAIMFGLAFSTLLTLGLVPVLYSLFYRVDFSGVKG